MSAAPSLARVLRDRAEAMAKPGAELTFATDSDTDGTDYAGKVLLAIAKPGVCAVLTIDKAEYTLAGAIRLGELLGFPQAQPPAAIERAKKATR
jgi:hypothetical protein